MCRLIKRSVPLLRAISARATRSSWSSEARWESPVRVSVTVAPRLSNLSRRARAYLRVMLFSVTLPAAVPTWLPPWPGSITMRLPASD